MGDDLLHEGSGVDEVQVGGEGVQDPAADALAPSVAADRHRVPEKLLVGHGVLGEGEQLREVSGLLFSMHSVYHVDDGIVG